MATTNETTTKGEQYVKEVFETVKKRNPNELEFHQAVNRNFDLLFQFSINTLNILKQGILERIVEPERIITFRVPWVDDQGKVQVNRGFRSI